MPTQASKSGKTIRVGVVGIGRGQSFARSAQSAGMKLVALCDTWKEKLDQVGKQYNVKTYTDYDKFLEHDMDAVVLANYFHQHAPLAIKAMQAGLHVMSETTACKTMAEGVALARTVEKTGKIYLFAENYPYTAANQEMRRVYQTGEVGRVLYAEGEYNHPMSEEDGLRISPGLGHWRNNLPSTYYCTHAMAPLMFITDTMPLSVNALSIPRGPEGKGRIKQGDIGSVILCRMNNQAVFRLFGITIPGHSIWYRVHGTHGAMELERGGGYWGPGRLRVWHEEYDCPPAQPVERLYVPRFPVLAEQARKTGHGGGDFFTNYYFAQAIRTGTPPYLDIYRGLAMSVVGILAWKSCLADGQAFTVPNFHKESERRKYENDHWSPFPEDAGPGQPPVNIDGHTTPGARQLTNARKIWRSIGYKGK